MVQLLPMENRNDLHDLLNTVIPQTIDLLGREFPNGIQHVLFDAAETIAPSRLHPAFFGCFDWHSAVHSHWQLVRALRLWPDAPFAAAARARLDRQLTPGNLATEAAYVARRRSFEMPYGMAWVLQLCAELAAWNDADGGRWLANLAPLEAHAATRFVHYAQKISHPVRSGAHNQTAFAFGLALDWAGTRGSADAAAVATTLIAAAERFYAADVDAPLAYEPSGTDFLSPALGEADLMRRALPAETYTAWLGRFLPHGAAALTPVRVVDPSDGRLAHFAGLNLSRAWMLSNIADALPADDPRATPLRENAAAHRAAGLAYADHPDYMISHWVPSFAVYLLGR